MHDFAKLQWRCRRGTLELDVILSRYLERCYLAADAAEQCSFAQLLELQDADLLSYLCGNLRPASTPLILLVDKIRNLPAA